MRLKKAVSLIAGMAFLYTGAAQSPLSPEEPLRFLAPKTGLTRHTKVEIAEAVAFAQAAVVLRKLGHDFNNALVPLMVLSAPAGDDSRSAVLIREFLAVAQSLSADAGRFTAPLRENGRSAVQENYFWDGLDYHKPVYDLQKLMEMKPALQKTFAEALQPGGFVETLQAKTQRLRGILAELNTKIPRDWRIEMAEQGLHDLENRSIKIYRRLLEWATAREKMDVDYFRTSVEDLIEALNGVKWGARFGGLRFSAKDYLPVPAEYSGLVDPRPVLPALLSFVATVYGQPQQHEGEKRVFVELNRERGDLALVLEADRTVSSEDGMPLLESVETLARAGGGWMEAGPSLFFKFVLRLGMHRSDTSPQTRPASARFAVQAAKAASPPVRQELFPDEAAKPALRKKRERRVLIVDDEDYVRGILKRLIAETPGFESAEIREEPDGRDGLRAFHEWEPDLVLTDFGMPGMPGHEMARRIRETDAGKNAVIILVTGHSPSAAVLREARFDDLLLKPFDPDQIKTLLRMHLPAAQTHFGAGTFLVESSL